MKINLKKILNCIVNIHKQRIIKFLPILFLPHCGIKIASRSFNKSESFIKDSRFGSARSPRGEGEKVERKGGKKQRRKFNLFRFLTSNSNSRFHVEANISHVVASSASLDPVERFQATGSMEFREKPYLYVYMYIYIKPRFLFANFRECDSCSPGREIEFVLPVPSCGSRIFISNSKNHRISHVSA